MQNSLNSFRGRTSLPKALGTLGDNPIMATKPTTLQSYETLQEAAARTKLGERTLRRYIAEGRLIAHRAGRLIRLRPEDVDALFTPTNQWDGGAA